MSNGYGGCRRTASSTASRRTSTSSPTVATFCSMVRRARRLDSTNSTGPAPRLAASSPTAPEPANRSQNAHPLSATSAAPDEPPVHDASAEKSASRTLLEVGRVWSPGASPADVRRATPRRSGS